MASRRTPTPTPGFAARRLWLTLLTVTGFASISADGCGQPAPCEAPTPLKYSGGTGVIDRESGVHCPFEISNPEDLIALSQSPEDWDKHFVLTRTIDLCDLPISPIGSSMRPFEGSLDGGFFAVRHFAIAPGAAQDVGLFGVIGPSGSVSALAVSDVGFAAPPVPDARVGGLVGVNRGQIHSVSVATDLGNEIGFHALGGIAGTNAERGVIGGAAFDGVLSATCSRTGGIAGINAGVIHDSLATGTLSSVDPRRPCEDVGGLVGRNETGQIRYSLAAMEVDVSARSAGGLVGSTGDGIDDSIAVLDLANPDLSAIGDARGCTRPDCALSGAPTGAATLDPDQAGDPARYARWTPFVWKLGEGEVPTLRLHEAFDTRPTVCGGSLRAVCGQAYFDSNVNGRREPSERTLAGARISVASSDAAAEPIVTESDADGTYCFHLVDGSYEISAIVPECGAVWLATASPLAIETLGRDHHGNDVGAVCLGGRGARDPGFWLLPEGRSLLGVDDAASLNALPPFAGSGTGGAEFFSESDLEAFRDEVALVLTEWPLLGLPHELAAAILATDLNLREGFLDPQAQLHVDGDRFETIGSLLFRAVAASACSPADPACPIEQQQLAESLHRANADRDFVQAEPCQLDHCEEQQTASRCSREVCDATDNNCDGAADNGLLDLVAGSEVGECRPEVRSCITGAWQIADAGVAPVSEICGNGVDNDCDGVIDNPTACDAFFTARGFRASPGKALKASHEEASLELDGGAVDSEIDLTITPLRLAELPELDPGMTNVTKGPRYGYRFQPHGMKFKKKVRVKVPYNKQLLPPGSAPAEIRTFYFDDQSGRWRSLEIAAIDESRGEITSYTDHFTDMINATVTVPDHPQVSSHDATSLEELVAADPSAQINLIDAPRAASSGDAVLGYPIEIPPGRNGMEPRLSLRYSSSADNGWLGIGWDLPQSRVNIDTRWGVPRYDPADETETYVLDGNQLTPLAHRGPPQPRSAEKVFRKRIEGAFQRIVRHGDHPSAYWWETVDKDGKRSFYGGHPDAGGPLEDAILADALGNVFEWALVEERDLNGNAVHYEYDRVADAGVEGVPAPCAERCEELYLRSIDYTRSNGSSGAYTVTFIRDSELTGHVRRPDVIIDARGGFRRVTAELLARIEIGFQGRSVRSYDLEYAEGAFHKTLLQSVTQRGADGSVFHQHRFEYFDESRDPGGAYLGFQAAEDWQAGDDDVDAGLLGFGRASVLGGARGETLGGHLYAGFNPSGATKVGSGGGKLGATGTETETVLSLTDVDGDGLPDKLFQKEDEFFYRPNRSGPSGGSGFGEIVPLPTLPAISEETSATASGGPEVYFTGNGLLNVAFSFAETSTYLADVNGDGLPDLVRGSGEVLFNRRGSAGVPSFDADSSTSPVPVETGSVDGDGLVPDEEALEEKLAESFPLHDTLRRWVAPFTGQVRIFGGIRLVQEPGIGACSRADGVEAAIQRNGEELWSGVVSDTAEVTPSGLEAVAVTQGDRLYFRLQSRFDGSCDRVVWDPEIRYPGPLTTDANLRDPRYYWSSEDFTLGGRRGISVRTPVDGTVRLEGDLLKPVATTDDVTLIVTKNGATLFSQTLRWDQLGSIPVSLEFPVRGDDLDTLPVESDEIALRVRVDSPIDAGVLEWAPRLYYVEAPGAGGLVDPIGRPVFQLRPPYDVDLYPVNDLVLPQVPWIAPETGTATAVATLRGPSGRSGTVVFTAKSAGRRLAKRSFFLIGGTTQVEVLTFDVEEGDRVFFDFSVYDPEFGEVLLHQLQRSVQVSGETVQSALHRSDRARFFPLAHRGWSSGGYQGNAERAELPIVEADLVLPGASGSYDPRTAKSYPFYGDSFEETIDDAPTPPRWRGSEPRAWASATEMSASRLGIASLPDIPGQATFAGRRAVGRLSFADQIVGGGGVGLLSGSASEGNSHGELDFRDLNGDLFPDIVSIERIQYTTPTGGLEVQNREVERHDGFRASASTAANAGIGGSPASFFANGKSEVHATGATASRSNRTGSQMQPLGLGAGIGDGDSAVALDLIDLNGDGLPDRVTRTRGEDCQGEPGDDQICVELNLGYRFAMPEPWGLQAISDGDSDTLNLSATPIGFNAGIYDFAGGLSLADHGSHAGITLLDLNGDGLPDMVEPGTAPRSLRVAFNTGNGFAAPRVWPNALDNEVSRNASIHLGAGLYFTIPIPCVLASCAVILNPGIDGSTSMSRDEAAVLDVDGDGHPDYLQSSNDATLQVARSPVRRTNLLRTVHRPLGARLDLSYERVGNTFALPQSRWVLSRVEVFDGHVGDGVDTQVTTYSYDGGHFDRLERRFYGFSSIVERHRDRSRGDAVYREVLHEFANDSFYTEGLLTRRLLRDEAQKPFVETENTYLLRDVETGAEPADPGSTTATIFPQLVRVDQRFFEGGSTAQKSTFERRAYDALGNVSSLFDAGDVGADDDLLANFEYSQCASTHVVGVPTSIRVSNQGTLLRRREATVACGSGNVVQVRAFAGATASITDLDYLPNGNLRTVTGPANHRGQRYELGFSYDPVVSTHVSEIRDSFGYVSTLEHDLRFGSVQRDVDINANAISFEYDPFGRLSSVTGPYEAGAGTPTLRLEYHHAALPAWARARQHDSFRSATDPIDSVVFLDGLARRIQTKRDATIADPAGPLFDAMVVSGRLRYDHVGRTVQSFHPVVEPLGSPGVFNPSFDPIPPTVDSFDVLDRVTRRVLPDGTSTAARFGFGADRSGKLQFEQILTDQNGRKRHLHHDVRELLISSKDFLGGTAIWASHGYDAMSQLVSSRDDAGNLTTVAYDTLGRTVSLDSPDAGRSEFEYDSASNLVAERTAKLLGKGGAIRIEYDFNRPARKRYFEFPANDVAYAYGEPGAGENRAGRLELVTDASGSQAFAYGKLGEVTREVRTVASETQGASSNGPEVYATQYLFDTWGRLQRLTYPDGEVLTHSYDSGGQLQSASGLKSGSEYGYVSKIGYDKFAQTVVQELGNGVRTTFGYHPANRRLIRLVSQLPDGRRVQDAGYEFDAVGNVLSIRNDVDLPRPSEFGGPVRHSFQYDDLDRLVGAAGSYRVAPDKEHHYAFSQAYDSIHNVLRKQQTHSLTQPSGASVPQKKTSLDWSYTYESGRPHAPAHAGLRSFQYDASGNQLGWQDDRNGTRRTLVWDDENRIRSISEVGHEERYVYEDGGERVIKRGPQGETVYVNQYFTIRNREVGTKHVFAGRTRLVSKLMMQDKPGSNPAGGTPLEKDLYFYHGDHLGSSVWVTDSQGETYEHLEYLPSGETWVSETSDTRRTPYLFSANLLDPTTGLYYVGSRYYDPRLGVWQSTDPALEEYVGGAPNGGLFNPLNHNLYGFSMQNPVRYRDVDGRSPDGDDDEGYGPNWSRKEAEAEARSAPPRLFPWLRRRTSWAKVSDWIYRSNPIKWEDIPDKGAAAVNLDESLDDTAPRGENTSDSSKRGGTGRGPGPDPPDPPTPKVGGSGSGSGAGPASKGPRFRINLLPNRGVSVRSARGGLWGLFKTALVDAPITGYKAAQNNRQFHEQLEADVRQESRRIRDDPGGFALDSVIGTVRDHLDSVCATCAGYHLYQRWRE